MLYYVIYVYVCMNTHSICMSIITFPPVHLHIPSFSCGSPVLTACCGFSSESSSKSFLRTKKVMREQARQNINMNISWNERANISDIYFDTDLIRSETSGSTWIKSNQRNLVIIHYSSTQREKSLWLKERCYFDERCLSSLTSFISAFVKASFLLADVWSGFQQ